ncbi:hypothetical protein ZEAMMB73_Zm00001d038428 [Zea mays]|jgi:hypothetical protein|uniref:KIB1-4 beta-propeller domain-containing protein n=1 Tax=Zea mays TaxID=4577 RepID=A0A1D6M6A4_MAIZE|nr:hypothetical protein ZEAMMB73_Zm00001d038428 [Zea mays]
MAVPPRWANLNIDLVTEIMNRVPCAIDRTRMAAVCQAWLAAVARAERLTFQLPSLLFPPADANDVYCYLSGCREHNMLAGPRYFGSYDDGWFFVAYGHTCGHRLLNIRTGDSHALPDILVDHVAHEIHSMVILAAAISCPPEFAPCAAGIVSYQPELDAPRRRHLAFWRQGDEVAVCNVLPGAPVGPGWEPEDVVYYRRNFLFLTQGGHILVCNPLYENDDSGNILLVPWKLMPFPEWSFFRDCMWEYPGSAVVRACYLVESRASLDMVVRLAAHHHAPTSSFKVFYMDPIDIIEPGDDDEEADEYLRTWNWFGENAWGGRMLFVGRGCSKSYEVREYPGLKDGIFFLDDRSFYDAEMMFGRVNERQYPCSDIGRWSPPEGPLPSHVELYFPERVPSYNSPPAWLLH